MGWVSKFHDDWKCANALDRISFVIDMGVPLMGALSWIAGYATWTGAITVLVYILATLALYRNISIRRERDKATRALSETNAKHEAIANDCKWLYDQLIQSKNRLRDCQEQITEVYDLTKVRRSSTYLVDAIVVPESLDEQRLNEIAKRINGGP
jgi:hypothetical protein